MNVKCLIVAENKEVFKNDGDIPEKPICNTGKHIKSSAFKKWFSYINLTF